MATPTRKPVDESFEAKNGPDPLLARLDSIVSGLESISRRMDALEASRQPRKANEKALEAKLRDGGFSPLEVIQKSAADDRACTDAQVRYDSVFQHVGRRAPPSAAYERAGPYRARMLKELARYSSKPGDAKLDFAYLLKDQNAFKAVEAKILADVTSRADAILVDARPGEIMKRESVDPVSGRKTFEYFGRSTFVNEMKPEARQLKLLPCGEFFNVPPRRGWGS